MHHSIVQCRPAWAVLLCACLAVFLLVLSSPAGGFQGPAAEEKLPVLEGTATDAAGAPVKGVALRLEPQRANPSQETRVVTATTDQEGKYVLVAPGIGRYTLRATAAGFRLFIANDLDLNGPERRQFNLVLEPTLPKEIGAKPGARNQTVEFSDAPNFTVAGITDRSNMGLHGSDANVRTSDVLARETAALKSDSAERSAVSGAGDSHRLAGDAKEGSGDALGAVKEYEAAVKADPSEQNYFAWGAELLLHRAGQAAVEIFANGAKAHPGSARMLAGLGAAYYSNGQYEQAAASLCRASDVDPADPAPYLFLGRMEQAAADPLPCSDARLSRLATSQPANPQANFFYGLVLWKKARKTQDAANLARAEQLFRKAVELKPEFAEVYVQLGMLYNARGEKDKALKAFRKAVSADRQSSAAHYQLSLAYRRRGDATKADAEMKLYSELRRSEDAALEKERRELRQFVTILEEGKSARP
jgi:tetratricopeptide (TPR) repeat protein